MFATVQVAIAQPDLIIIPNSAILMNNDTTSVFIETKPWIFERREIQLGFEDDDHVRVLSGLKAGDRIVAYGGVFIND
jgi:cobalt-zinc-cadmium efflux system membrane fusion protein